jgi:hypothetical protein
MGWLAVAAVLLWPVVEAIRIIAQPVHEVVFGDIALSELAARDAWRLHQLLGPNAHPGFNHSGPAVFYLLAPTVRFLEPGPGLYLGAVLINAAALVATVAFVWRRAGSRVALWTAAALNLFCLALSLDTLRQPWNPVLLIVPMVLFVVLWAGAVTRVPGAWLWAAVIGSYELQTHVGTAPFVAVMLALAGVWGPAARWRRISPHRDTGRSGRAGWRRPARLTGVGALVLIWLPSTVELFADHPNNVSRIWQYLLHNHSPRIAMHSALGIVLRSIAIYPSRRPTSPLFGSLTWWAAPVPASRTKEVAAVLLLGAAVVLIGWLVRRQQPFAAALACASLIAVPVATFTVSRAGDDNYAYLTGWLAFVPCLLLVALGMGLLGPRPSTDRRAGPNRFPVKATAVLAVVAVACAGVTAVSDLRQRSIADVNRLAASITPVVGDAKAQLRPADRWVGIYIASSGDYIIAADVILELERLGYHTVVAPPYVNLFGPTRTDIHPVQVLFTFYLANDPAGARLARGPVVSNAGGTVMTAWRPTG